MAFKLDKHEKKERTRISSEMHDAFKELEGAINEYNETVEAAYNVLQAYLDRMNQKIADAKEFTGNVHTRLQEEYEERSDKWHESEKGQSVSSMLSLWEDFEDEEISIDKPDEAELPDNPADEFDQLPEEPEET